MDIRHYTIALDVDIAKKFISAMRLLILIYLNNQRLLFDLLDSSM